MEQPLLQSFFFHPQLPAGIWTFPVSLQRVFSETPMNRILKLTDTKTGNSPISHSFYSDQSNFSSNLIHWMSPRPRWHHHLLKRAMNF